MRLITYVQRGVRFDWAIEAYVTIAVSIGLTNNAIVSQRSNFVWCIAIGMEYRIGMLP
jgi:hypothetical protein